MSCVHGFVYVNIWANSGMIWANMYMWVYYEAAPVHATHQDQNIMFLMEMEMLHAWVVLFLSAWMDITCVLLDASIPWGHPFRGWG